MEKGDKDKGDKGKVITSFTDLSAGQIKKILNEEAKSNKMIDQELKSAALEMQKEVTLLLLGALSPLPSPIGPGPQRHPNALKFSQYCFSCN